MKNFLLLFAFCFTLTSIVSCNKDEPEDDEEMEEEMQDCDAEGDCLRLTIDGNQTVAKFTQGASIDLLGTTTINFTGLQEITQIFENAIQIVITNPQEGTLNYTFTQSGEPAITFRFDQDNAMAIQAGTLNIIEYNKQQKFIEGEFSGMGIDTEGESYSVTDGYFKVTLQ